MAKNKTRKRAGFSTQKIFKWVRIGALAAPAIGRIMRPVSNEQKARDVVVAYFGYDMNTNTFKPSALVQGWGPFIASVGVTYGIPKLAGIIRGL